MNVVDCLAIAPYYLTLFVFPDPEIQVSNEDDLNSSTALPGLAGEEEEEAGLGDVGRIMQVFRIARIMRCGICDRVYIVKFLIFGIKDLQAGPEVSGPSVHRPHGEDQLEGPGPPVHVGGHGHAGVREPRVLH